MHLATGRGLRDLIAYFKTCRSRSPRGSLAAIQKARISAADLRGKVRQALVLPASGWKPEASARDSSARCSGSRLTESLLAQSLADASGFLVRSALICGDFDREMCAVRALSAWGAPARPQALKLHRVAVLASRTGVALRHCFGPSPTIQESRTGHHSHPTSPRTSSAATSLPARRKETNSTCGPESTTKPSIKPPNTLAQTFHLPTNRIEKRSP